MRHNLIQRNRDGGRRRTGAFFWLGAVVLTSVLLGVPRVVRAQRHSMGGTEQFVSDSTPVAARTETNPSVTLLVKDSTIKYIIYELARQAHVQVVVNKDDKVLAKRIKVAISNFRLMTALTYVLQGTGLVAQLTPDSQTVVIRSSSQSTTATPSRGGVVIATITDSVTGAPVVGARVSILESSVVEMTSQQGGVTLANVPAGEHVVEVRAFGYKPASRTVTVIEGGRRALQVSLASVTTVLSGVVTTATGIQSRLSVGSDITVLNVDSIMQTAPINTVTDLLENRVPGLTVVHTDGTPGDPSRLLLRGASSVYGSNNPIVVVDGVRVYDPQDLGSVQANFGLQYGQATSYGKPGTGSPVRPSPLDQIDPNTIETIEVLKGPSASALYGSDAANGVIVITTKRGRPGNTHWSVSLDQGVEYIPGSYPAFDYTFGHRIDASPSINGMYAPLYCIAGYRYASLTYQVPGQRCTVDSTVAFQALNDPRYSPLTDGPLSSASATISGGAQAFSYSFTGSFQDTHGMTKLPAFTAQLYDSAVGSPPPSWIRNPDDYQSWSINGQIVTALSSNARLTVSDLMSNSTQRRTGLGLSAVTNLIGSYFDTSSFIPSGLIGGDWTKITQATLTSTATASLQWQIQPWLPLTVQAGLNQNSATDKTYLPAGLPETIVAYQTDTLGQYGLGQSNATQTTLNANTTIPVTLGRGRSVQVAGGVNFVEQSVAQQDINSLSVPVGVSDPTSFVQQDTYVQQLTQNSATYGWFVEPQLNLGSRLFVTPGIRLDGGTSAGNNAGFTAFPKMNASYVAVDNSTGGNGSAWSNVMTLLRLRGSYGIAGVQPTPGQSLRLFTEPQLVSLDGGTVNSNEQVINAIGNTLLHPERSREFEGGFDAELLQNRISVTVTYYDKLRLDAIESEPVALSVIGQASQYLNIGNIRNTGLEITAQAQVLQSYLATWNINYSVSTNTNRVLSTTANVGNCTQTSDVMFASYTIPCLKAGYPLGGLFAPQIVGISDVNGDGIIESNEVVRSDSLVYVGSSDPRYTAAFGTTVALWNSRLTVNAQGSYQNGLLQNNGLYLNYLSSFYDAVGTNWNTQNLKALATELYGFQVVNTFRIDALSVNYVLPAAVAHMFRSQQATLTLQGSNLLLKTNYAGKDPNTTGFDATDQLYVQDTGLLPEPRTWRLSMRITQ